MKSFTFFLVLLLTALMSLATMAQIPVAGLQMWLKSDAGVDTLNGKVSRWHDQSGKGNDAIQANTSRQPLFVDSVLNQKPILRFDGIDDKLGFTGTTPMSQFTLFMVVKNNAPVPGQDHSDHVMAFGAPTGEGYFVLFGGLDRISDRINIGGPSGGVRATATNIAAYGEWRIISIVTNQTIYNTTLRWNGSNAAMTPDGGTDIPISVPMGTGGGIGGADNSPFGFLLTAHCDFAEAIVYDTLLTDSEILAVENYLADKYIISITTGIEDHQEEIIPEQFTLSQNYPNPFNPSTVIDFNIPQDGFVIIKLFDITGREVRILMRKYTSAGFYTLNFNAEGLAGGVYFYTIDADKYKAVKKMLLVR